MRYADKQSAIDFDAFVGCIIRLELLFREWIKPHTKIRMTEQFCVKHGLSSHVKTRITKISKCFKIRENIYSKVYE